jgi:putative transposase
VELVVSDDHDGLKKAVREMLPNAAWQRCYVHFLRNALDHLPRKAAHDPHEILFGLSDQRDASELDPHLFAGHLSIRAVLDDFACQISRRVHAAAH